MKSSTPRDFYTEINIDEYLKSCAICRNLGYTQSGLYCNLDKLYVQPNGFCVKYELNEIFRGTK
jgi:hypothetical protein